MRSWELPDGGTDSRHDIVHLIVILGQSLSSRVTRMRISTSLLTNTQRVPRLVRGGLLAISLITVGACSSDSGPTSPVGRWILETIDGKALPQPFDQTTTIHFDEIDVDATGFAQHRIRTANNAPNTPSVQDFSGTWTMIGSDVTFTTTGGTQEIYTATLSGDVLTRARSGVLWLYRKQ